MPDISKRKAVVLRVASWWKRNACSWRSESS